MTSTLELTVTATQQSLEERLREATGRTTVRGKPRDTYARTDAFLAATSRHLAAVDEVLLPIVRKRLPDGPDRVHEYLQQARHLEVAMVLLKARLYGEAQTVRLPWPRVWRDVRTELEGHNEVERRMVSDLLPNLETEEHSALAHSVYRSEIKAPTRPHPFLPHTGFFGSVARKLWGTADRFWDAAQGRIVPDPVRPPSREHSHDSLMAQWLMAEPHFDQSATVIDHKRSRD